MNAFRFLDAPLPAGDALALLPGPLAAWFAHHFGDPTPVQRLAWPALPQSDNLLVSAPTGTGKTLAAVVPILADLLRGSGRCGGSPLRLLAVAPLKALVNDAARNLERHLADLEEFLPPGTPLPRVAVRTGDTPGQERKQLRENPPDILLTTPESLAVLLSQPAAAAALANLAWVLVDEVHALAGNKRGADLAVCLERLSALSAGPVLRRVGLSATATPLESAASWLAGVGRSCTIVRSPATPAPAIQIEPLPEGVRFLAGLVDRLSEELPRHRSSLIFTNTRSLAERLSWQLRRRLPDFSERIAVHHSALSAGRRREVERRFKNGELAAVVSSTSLELGIDVGSIDLAVLVHPPGDVIRLLQRIGRAGHEPGGLRRGLILTASAAELLEAAVTTASGQAGQCEPLTLPASPLDVLCQQVLGACCARSWEEDDLYALVRRAAPFAGLSRRDFADCLAYLRGLDAGGDAWLPARLGEDGDCWRVLDARTARLLRRNLGTILADETVPVLLRANGAAVADDDDPFGDQPRLEPIGEVEEAFADRLQPGDRFLFDGRCLEFRTRQDTAAVVEEVAGRPRTPTWTGDGWPLSAQLAQRLYLLRLRAAEALREGPAALARLLGEEYALDGPAAEQLSAYFQQQESVSEIPDATTLLAECVATDRGVSCYLHTTLNRPGNDALARVAVARLARDPGRSSTSAVADLGLALHVRGPLDDVPGLLRRLLSADGFREELDAALAQSETLRTRFTRVATTGLMLLRNPEGRRRKVGGADWGGRQLFERVRAHDGDFVLLRQALREVREETCDAESALAYAERLPLLTVRCRWLFRPSPFAAAWTQEEPGAADTARTAAEALARLHAELTGRTRAEGGDASR